MQRIKAKTPAGLVVVAALAVTGMAIAAPAASRPAGAAASQPSVQAAAKPDAEVIKEQLSSLPA